MKLWQSFSSRVRPGLFLALVITLSTVYLMTYSAFFESQDGTRVLDAASSFASFGDFGRDESLWRDPPEEFDYVPDYPLMSFDSSEVLMPLIVSLWYRIVYLIPGIGLVHGTWLFNIIVVALTVGLFFQWARLLRYKDSVALVGALMLGLCTALWVYSKTLFREPLIGLLLLMAAVALESTRKVSRGRGFVLWVVALVAILGAILSKNSTVMALPALMVLMLPVIRVPQLMQRGSDILLVGLLLFVVALVGTMPVDRQFSDILLWISRRSLGRVDFGQEALTTYLFSIGASLWSTSPVLLLALPGSVMLLRQGRRRLLWCAVWMVINYAVGHAYSTGPHWFGGVSWPPRYLLPVIPFAMLLVLPVLEWVMQPRRVVWRIGVGILAAYGLLIQVIGAISRLLAYNGLLPPAANGLYEWSGGSYDVRYLRWLVLPRTWASVGLDVAWARINAPLIPVVFGLLTVVGLVVLWQWHHRRIRWLLPLLMIGLLINLGIGLRLLYLYDREYDATRQPLFDMLAVLQNEAEDGQPLLLEGNADVTHDRFLLNYNRVDTVRPIVIEFSPGEAASEEAPGCVRDRALFEREVVCVVSDYPAEMLAGYTPRVIDFLATHHDRIWYLAHNSAFLPWSVRPVEQYLATNYYLLREVTTSDPTVRLLEYGTIPAPSRYDERLPEVRSNLIYGDAIRLLGFTLPRGMQYESGDVVPITLWWQAMGPIEADYVVAWFIVKADGALPPIQGVDSMPDAGFAPTSQWQPGRLVWDNRAIALPADIPDGIYLIWVLLYPAGSGGTERLSVSSGESIDDEIGVLPLSITISTHDE